MFVKGAGHHVCVRCGHFFRFEVGIVQWLLFPVAVLAGTLMVVQSGCNGMLENIIERPVMVGIVSLSVGLTALVIAGIATGELGFPDNGRVMQGPWWAWLGGLCGAASLLSQPIAAPRLGAGTYIGLFITASSVMSVIFDHFGWLGFAEHPAGIARVLGCALMVVGIALISLF
jgi:transporter family-2 protein